MGAYNQIFVCTGILTSILAGLPVGTCAAAAGGSSAVATLGTALGLSKCAAVPSSMASGINSISNSFVKSLLALPWWRCMFALATLPALLQWLALRTWAPESPAWLQAQAGRRNKSTVEAAGGATSTARSNDDDNGCATTV